MRVKQSQLEDLVGFSFERIRTAQLDGKRLWHSLRLLNALPDAAHPAVPDIRSKISRAPNLLEPVDVGPDARSVKNQLVIGFTTDHQRLSVRLDPHIRVRRAPYETVS